MIAEDDPDICTPYKIALEKRGHSVDIAQDGEECINIYKTSLKHLIKHSTINKDDYSSNYQYAGFINTSRSNTDHHNDHTPSSSSNSSLLFSPPPPYDAVVLDYRMPKKDGLGAAKEILALNPSERIIFASAYVDETLRESI